MEDRGRAFRRLVRHPLTNVGLEGRFVGPGRVVLTGTRLLGSLSVSQRGPRDDSIEELAECVRGYLDGSARGPCHVLLDLGWCTAFQERVIAAARTIPRGRTVTYAELAAMAGSPRAVRAAATVMRRNRYPLIVPCHRVVAVAGIGGFMGRGSGSAVALKAKLLAHEGAGSRAKKHGLRKRNRGL